MPSITYEGYRPGALAGVVDLHMAYYAPVWNFGRAFETKVASELAEFLERHDSERDLFLTAWMDDKLVGSVTIDATGGGKRGAHLRWFIVSDDVRGKGVGGALMKKSMAFCDAHGYAHRWLTTFAGLDAARALYEKYGFVLTAEKAHDQWAGGVSEQLFEFRQVLSA